MSYESRDPLTLAEVLDLKESFEAAQEVMQDIVTKYARDCVEGDGGGDTVWWESDREGNIELVGHWEVSWQYGGHAEGHTYVPLDYILDPVGFKAKYDADKEAAKVKKAKADKAAIEAKERAQLAKLREKYESSDS